MIDKKMENRTEFEGLVSLAVKEYSGNGPAICETSDCLSNDTLYALYEGSLPKSKRHEAISHLAECKGCCTDLQVYTELMKSA